MAVVKGGLGRGLDALFMDNNLSENSASQSLKLSEIVTNKNQPRKDFDDTTLSELAESIRVHGIIQPLLVRPMANGSYQLVAGERRYRASRLAGLTAVPVVIKELSDNEVLVLGLIENLQRENLNSYEEAMGYKELIDKFDLSQEQVALQVGKSRPAIANTLRLLELPETVIDKLRNLQLSAGHARALLPIKENEKLINDLARNIIDKGLSVRDTERLVKGFLNNKDGQVEKKIGTIFFGDPYYKEVEIALNEHMARKVKINAKDEDNGTIEIQFYGREDFAELIKKFN